LVAERDPFAADLSDYFLRTEGFVTRVALDARTAREILEQEAVTVMVVDVLIPGGGGLELCQLAHERGSIAVLVISALDSREQALRAGADAFLQKPFDSIRLVSTVRDLLGTSAYLRRSVWA